MDWIQWLSMLGTLGAFCYFIHNETCKKIDQIREETKQIREEIKAQAARTDTLYQMFVNLLQSNRS